MYSRRIEILAAFKSSSMQVAKKFRSGKRALTESNMGIIPRLTISDNWMKTLHPLKMGSMNAFPLASLVITLECSVKAFFDN